jgi:capsular polysaccharide biosynthesis protein
MQIKLFSAADIIISPHGAAMAFILFCNKNATIIELMIPRPLSRHYGHISWHFEFDYYRLMCDKINDDMNIDISHIKRFLEAHPKFNV